LRSLNVKRLDYDGSTTDAKLPDCTRQAVHLKHQVIDENEGKGYNRFVHVRLTRSNPFGAFIELCRLRTLPSFGPALDVDDQIMTLHI
jgi:hypothetical protein